MNNRKYIVKLHWQCHSWCESEYTFDTFHDAMSMIKLMLSEIPKDVSFITLKSYVRGV
jgi:hypothetical protein